MHEAKAPKIEIEKPLHSCPHWQKLGRRPGGLIPLPLSHPTFVLFPVIFLLLISCHQLLSRWSVTSPPCLTSPRLWRTTGGRLSTVSSRYTPSASSWNLHRSLLFSHSLSHSPPLPSRRCWPTSGGCLSGTGGGSSPVAASWLPALRALTVTES